MPVLIESLKEVLPVTKLSHGSKKILEEFKSGEKQKYIVTRNNMPEAVFMSVTYYEELMDLISSHTQGSTKDLDILKECREMRLALQKEMETLFPVKVSLKKKDKR